MEEQPLPPSPGVYQIRNLVNGKVYVGLTVNLKNRWYGHKKDLRKGVHCNPHLQSSWWEYGEENFAFEVLEEVVDRSLLSGLERGFISKLNSADPSFGYNLSTGGESGFHRSRETAEKIGASNRGKVRTPEMKTHMRSVKAGQGKGRVKSEQEIANLKAAHARRRKDPEGYAAFRTPEARKRQGRCGSKAWSKVKGGGK